MCDLSHWINRNISDTDNPSVSETFRDLCQLRIIQPSTPAASAAVVVCCVHSAEYLMCVFQKFNADYDLSAKEGADSLAFISLMEEKLRPALVRRLSLCVESLNMSTLNTEVKPVWISSVVDLRLLDRAEELRGPDSPLVRRAHAVPSELLPARTDAARSAGKTATAARRREPGGRGGAGEGGEDTAAGFTSVRFLKLPWLKSELWDAAMWETYRRYVQCERRTEAVSSQKHVVFEVLIMETMWL